MIVEPGSNRTYSVVVPHYNSADGLSRLLDSIPLRDDIQVIVIDDISTDGSFAKCKLAPCYSHVTFIQAEKKCYAGGARNRALAIAEGDYVLFADSDDYFSAQAFVVFDRELRSGEDIILFKTASFIEGTDRPGNRDNYRNNRLLLDPRSAALGAVGPIAKLVKRALIRDHSLYFSEVIAANDIAFSVKSACLARTIKVVDEVVYHISQGDDSLTATVSLEKSLSRLQEQSKRIQLVKKYQPVAVFRYCLMHSLLVRFEAYAGELQSAAFDRELTRYKRELGLTICILSRVISKTPFAAKGLNYFFRWKTRLISIFRKPNFLQQG